MEVNAMYKYTRTSREISGGYKRESYFVTEIQPGRRFL